MTAAGKRPNRKVTFGVIYGLVAALATAAVNTGIHLPAWLAPWPPFIIAVGAAYQAEGEADEVNP